MGSRVRPRPLPTRPTLSHRRGYFYFIRILFSKERPFSGMGFELLHGPLTSLISLGFTHKITRTIESTCCYLSFPNRLAHFSLALDQINHSLKNIGKERNERFSLKKAAEYVHGLIKDAYEKFIFYKF